MHSVIWTFGGIVARTGLYKSDIKKARDSLIAQSLYPSVDAVRVALGNTGSKSTIHKYLKELEEEEGTGTRKGVLSDALADLVERLAARLQEEAEERIAAVTAESAQKEMQHREARERVEQDLTRAQEAAQTLEARLEAEIAAHAQIRSALQAEVLALRTAEVQVVGLNERLHEHEAHRQSLEEKHAHARQALEHYRQTSKEQRDQDARRHEHQLQQLQAELRQAQQANLGKQEEVIQLNQDGAKLVGELSQARIALYDAQRLAREQATKLEFIPAMEQKLRAATERLDEKQGVIDDLTTQLRGAEMLGQELSNKVQRLEVELAGARANADGQLGLAAELRRLMAEKG